MEVDSKNEEHSKSIEAVQSTKSLLTESQKSTIMRTCLCSLTVACMMIYNIAYFLPTFIKNNTKWQSEDGYELDSSNIALIISIFFIAQIIMTPFISKIKNCVGSKNMLLIGFTMLSVTTFGLGAVTWIYNPRTFMYVSLMLRFF